MLAEILFILVVLIVHHTAWGIFGLITKDNTYADYGWATGVGVLIVASLWLQPETLSRHWIVTVLGMIWSVRLLYVVSSRHKKEDKRYAKFRKKWGEDAALQSFTKIYLLQALLLFIVASPIWFSILSHNNIITGLDILGVAIWCAGFFFEAVGDAQLKWHKKHGKGLLTTGLWKYTRHPNYFGESVQWLGLWIIAISAGGILTIISPILIYVLVRYLSGVPLLEKQLKKKRGWKTYAEKTPVFFPWK